MQHGSNFPYHAGHSSVVALNEQLRKLESELAGFGGVVVAGREHLISKRWQ